MTGITVLASLPESNLRHRLVVAHVRDDDLVARLQSIHDLEKLDARHTEGRHLTHEAISADDEHGLCPFAGGEWASTHAQSLWPPGGHDLHVYAKVRSQQRVGGLQEHDVDGDHA